MSRFEIVSYVLQEVTVAVPMNNIRNVLYRVMTARLVENVNTNVNMDVIANKVIIEIRKAFAFPLRNVQVVSEFFLFNFFKF